MVLAANPGPRFFVIVTLYFWKHFMSVTYIIKISSKTFLYEPLLVVSKSKEKTQQ